MKYLTIKPNELYLLEQEIPKSHVTNFNPDIINHIWIYDRSGSMYSLLGQLCEDLIAKAKQIPVGDTITLGWFSGEGQYNFILKGFKITDQKDYSVLERAIRANSTTLGCTCFSDILINTETVITDLQIFSSNFALTFLSDGYPVVSSYEKEVKEIFRAIENIKGKITSSLLVGQGNYYNKTLMTDMAEKLGGSVIHSDNLLQFNYSLESFLTNSRNSIGTKIIVELEKKSNLVFSLNESQINIYKPNEQNEIMFTPTKEKDLIYYLVDSCEGSKKIKEIKFTKANTRGRSSSELMVKAAYAAAISLIQKNKIDLALQILSIIGDRAMMDLVINAFTNKEYGFAENSILECMIHPSKRFSKGRALNYLPDPNAFCVVDLLELLSQDKEAVFYPRHPLFQYNRIGKAAKQTSDYPKFEADPLTSCNFSQLTWNEELLNLSVLAKINGYIQVPDNDLGLANKYPTFVWRNYAIIKDGMVNVTDLPISCSEATYNILKEKELIKIDNWYKNDIYILNLNSIPVMNSNMAKNPSAKELCEKIIKEQYLKAYQKVYKSYLIEPESKPAITLNEKQQEFLTKYGINPKTGAFEPKTESTPPTDHYMAKAFSVKLQGFSSLPKVTDVEAKLNAGKPISGAGKAIAEAISSIKNSPIASLPVNDIVTQTWLKQTLDSKQKELSKLRYDIQKTKFAVVMGKASFIEFNSREDNTITINDINCTLKISEVKIDL